MENLTCQTNQMLSINSDTFYWPLVKSNNTKISNETFSHALFPSHSLVRTQTMASHSIWHRIENRPLQNCTKYTFHMCLLCVFRLFFILFAMQKVHSYERRELAQLVVHFRIIIMLTVIILLFNSVILRIWCQLVVVVVAAFLFKCNDSTKRVQSLVVTLSLSGKPSTSRFWTAK